MALVYLSPEWIQTLSTNGQRLSHGGFEPQGPSIPAALLAGLFEQPAGFPPRSHR